MRQEKINRTYQSPQKALNRTYLHDFKKYYKEKIQIYATRIN